jgi:hypothetical protein
MTPSAFERVALVSREGAPEALSGAQDVDSDGDAKEIVEGPCGAPCGLSDARASVRAPGVHSRRVDFSVDVAGDAQTTEAPAGATCSGPRRRLRSHPFSHPPGGSAWLRRAPGGRRHRGGSRENAAETGIS